MGEGSIPTLLAFKAAFRFTLSDSAGFLSALGFITSAALSFFFKFPPYRNVYLSYMLISVLLFQFLSSWLFFLSLWFAGLRGIHDSRTDFYTYIYGADAGREVFEIYQREVVGKGDRVVKLCEVLVVISIVLGIASIQIVPFLYPEVLLWQHVSEISFPVPLGLALVFLPFSPLFILIYLVYSPSLRNYAEALKKWMESRGVKYLKCRGVHH